MERKSLLKLLVPRELLTISQASSSVDQCIPCSPGCYCDAYGLSSVAGRCAAGYYCILSANSSTPPGDATGGICPNGTYCPPGSSDLHCATVVAIVPVLVFGLLQQRAILVIIVMRGSSLLLLPIIAGNICPAGSYCPAGSSAPILCPLGTFGPSPGAGSLGECLPCTAGNFCNETGLIAVESTCFAGFYCPNGTRSPSLICTLGHYCPAGTADPIPCFLAFFQHVSMQIGCIECPAGFFFDCGTINPIICPVGSFSARNRKLPTDHLCPSGTYNNLTGLQDLHQCSPCPLGYYCPGQASLSLQTDAQQAIIA